MIFRKVFLMTTIWEKRARVGQQQLEEIFWNYKKFQYNVYTPYYEPEFKGSYSLLVAQAIDVLLDSYQRTEDNEVISKIDELLLSISKRSSTESLGEKVPLALSILRAYELTSDNTYLDYSEKVWSAYNGEKEYILKDNLKASVIAMVIILGLRLFEHTNKKEYLRISMELYSWYIEHFYDDTSGFIKHQLFKEIYEKKQQKKPLYTIDQGSYIGVLIEMFKQTKNDEYLLSAFSTAKLTFNYFGKNQTGILRHEGSEDAGLYKGLFIAYLEELLYYNFDHELYSTLIKNGEAAWQSLLQYKIPVYGSYWHVPNEDDTVTLATHLSGCKLMEVVNTIHVEYGNKRKN